MNNKIWKLHSKVEKLITCDENFGKLIGNSKNRINAEQEIQRQYTNLYIHFKKRGMTDKQIYKYFLDGAKVWVLRHEVCGQYNHEINLDNYKTDEEKEIRIDHICRVCEKDWNRKNPNGSIQNYEFILKNPIKVTARSLTDARWFIGEDIDFFVDRLSLSDLKLDKITMPTSIEHQEYVEDYEDGEEYE